MNKIFLLLFFLFITTPLYAADENVYYARCNIRTRGDKIATYDKWLTDPVGISAGTKIVSVGTETEWESERDSVHELHVAKITLEDGRKFKFPVGPLEKYLQTEPLVLSSLSQELKEAFKNDAPIIGMTKDQVFIALCAPNYVGNKKKESILRRSERVVTITEKLTIEDMKGFDLWVYQRTRSGKKFWVQFNDHGVSENMFWEM